MSKLPGLQLRGSVYRFRLRVPPKFAIRRKEVARSLETQDRVEARRRLSEVWAAWERLAKIVRDKAMTRDQVEELVRDFIRTEINEYHLLHKAAEQYPSLVPSLQQQRDQLAQTRKLVLRDLESGTPRHTQAYFEEFLERAEVKVERGSGAYRELMRSLAFGWLEAIDRLDDGSQAAGESREFAPGVSARALPSPSAPPLASRPETSLTRLIPAYERYKARGGAGASWQVEIRTALAWFSAWFGSETSVGALTKLELVAYRDGLLELPANWTKKLPGMSIRDAADHGKSSPLPKLDVAALQAKRWGPVHDFLKWAVENGHATANPAEGVKVPVSKALRAKKRRDQFEIEDLQQIFGAPLYKGMASEKEWWKPGALVVRNGIFWVPLLALFTGGRRGELCGLRTDDVVDRGGILCLMVREHSDDAGTVVRTLKNADSWRLVPIHPELIKIGFGAYVEARRRAGAEQLFDISAARNFDAFGKHFARFLNKVGVKTGRNCFHSFRHCMEQVLRENVDDFTARFRITGRISEHSSEGYGKGHTAETLYSQICKIEYTGLDLSHLYP